MVCDELGNVGISNSNDSIITFEGSTQSSHFHAAIGHTYRPHNVDECVFGCPCFRFLTFIVNHAGHNNYLLMPFDKFSWE